MKRFFSVILSLVFLVSLMTNFAFATEEENLITNIAPEGIAYSSSEKNSLWTPAESVINGKYGGVDGEWQGWECAYPEVSIGQDTSNGFSGEYFGINFKNQCYDIYEIRMNIGLHTLAGGQNATYTIQALVDGVWEDVVILKDDQAVPTSEKYADYNAVMSDQNASHRVNATLYYTLDEPITTNNIRVTVSDYAKNYIGGDVLIFPFVYEIELFGKEGYTPEILLPEGAYLTTDVAWHSYPSANNSANGTYPLLAVDGNIDTYWECVDFKGGEYFTLVFDKEYDIGTINLVLGTEKDSNDKNIIQATTLEYYYDGEWHVADNAKVGLVSGVATGRYGIRYLFETDTETGTASIVASGIRINFKKAVASLRVYSVEAHLDGTKTYAFENRFSVEQLNYASNGNIALIGKPYASNSFTPYSDVNYINDGLKNDKQWFTGTIDVPAYCGLTFDYPQKISRAVITVKSAYTYGIEAMTFEIQALVNDEYIKVAEGKSYCKETGYTTEYTFDEVETTDLRVVIKEMGGAIPNITELEVYNCDNSVIPMLSGIEVADLTIPAIPDNKIDDHACVKAPSNLFVPIVISTASVLLIAALVVVLVIYKKKKKEV